MRKYELADEVQNLMYRKIGDVDFDIVANTLRYQADKIKALEQELFALHNTYTNRVLRTYDGKEK